MLPRSPLLLRQPLQQLRQQPLQQLRQQPLQPLLQQPLVHLLLGRCRLAPSAIAGPGRVGSGLAAMAAFESGRSGSGRFRPGQARPWTGSGRFRPGQAVPDLAVPGGAGQAATRIWQGGLVPLLDKAAGTHLLASLS